MEKAVCATCESTKTTLRCGLCEDPSCKNCARLFDEDAFRFLPKVSDEIQKGVYCESCYQAKIAETAEAYEATMTAARNVDVYFKDQGKETRLIPRAKNIKYVINNCTDRDELILRFAFLAVLDGYSTIVDVDVVADKVRDGSYQTTNYHGSAVPANARPDHIPRDRSLRHNPN
jgi:hypothetical protein